MINSFFRLIEVERWRAYHEYTFAQITAVVEVIVISSHFILYEFNGGIEAVV